MMPTKKTVVGAVGHSKGVHGSTVNVHYAPTNPGEWAGVYRVSTHGKSVDQVQAELDAIHAHHSQKEVRLTGFGAIVTKKITVRGKQWEWGECSIAERGENAVELVVRMRDVDGVAAPGFPLVMWFGGMETVPDNNWIVDTVKAALTKGADAAVDAQQMVAALNARLGGGV